MKKADAKEFADFILLEAKRYVRDIHPEEIKTWFETFRRTPLEDFKIAWAQHKNHPKHGGFFPNIPMLQAILRTTGAELVARDWRCSEQVGNERCQFPGGIFLAGSRDGLCAAHYRLKGSADYTDAKSLQIIERSTDYKPPKTPMEQMERGAAYRAAAGARWRKLRGVDAPTRRPGDELPTAIKPPEPETQQIACELDAAQLERVNRDLAAEGGVAE